MKTIKNSSFSFIIGKHPKLLKEIKKAIKASQTDCNVLICGEHGTGKELFARAIHMASKRSNKPFVKVNCAAIPDTLIESEFFGYEEGAFTGAKKKGKKGLFEQAHQGTIFLDEVGDLSLAAQAKLLTVIQDREFIKVGGENPIKVDVRIIAATNKDLPQMIKEKKFREDLYYRLNVVKINLPPLRERKSDIRLLADYYLHLYCKKYNLNKYFSDKVIEFFENYTWPGNVRELFNVIEYAIVMSEDTEIKIEDLPQYILENINNKQKEPQNLRNCYETLAEHFKNRTWKEIKMEFEKNIITELMKKYKTKTEMINVLKLSRSQFYEKLNKLGIGDNYDERKKNS